ncbi:MAG: hypothetical protein ABJB10_13925, partial [Mesorhizobium sp.]
TIYSSNERYRGAYNDRMMLFMNGHDRSPRGLEPCAAAALEAISDDGVYRRVDGMRVLDYPMSLGRLRGTIPNLTRCWLSNIATRSGNDRGQIGSSASGDYADERLTQPGGVKP